MTDEAHDKAIDARDQFIPVRKSDILDALVDHGHLTGDGERSAFRQICRMLGSIYHHEYFGRLEELRADYYYFNPELDSHASFDQKTLDRAYGELIKQLTAVLKGANFIEVSQDEVERAHAQDAIVQVPLKTSKDEFRDVRFFRRGHHRETVSIKSWFGFRKRSVNALIYDDVVLLVAMKSAIELASKRDRKYFAQRKIRPGSVLIKYFRNIAAADLNALYPNVRVVMSTLDKVMLGVPALVGGVPILMNLWSTVTVLLLVAGFYLGISGAVQESEMKSALAGLTALLALGGFMIQQWVKYQRQSLKHQMELTDNIYYRNINNNAGIFDYIIGAAEEQECKEAFLAYYFLRTSSSPLTQAELDARIEAWLRQAFSVDIDFEVDDALGKLDRLGLLKRDGDKLSVPTPEDALARLDYVWDNYFQYNVVASAAAETV